MAVLFYQIGIFLAIQIASLFGKSARNTAILLISIFTILQVFMSWLLLLQFITIFISYNFSKRWLVEKLEPKNSYKPNYASYSYRENGGRSTTIVDLNDKNLDETIRNRAKLQNQIQDESSRRYNEDPEYKSAIDNVINKMVSGQSQNK